MAPAATKKKSNNNLARVMAARRAHANRFVVNAPVVKPSRPSAPRPAPRLATAAQANALWRELAAALERRRRMSGGK